MSISTHSQSVGKAKNSSWWMEMVVGDHEDDDDGDASKMVLSM